MSPAGLATTIRRLLAWRLIDFEPGNRDMTPNAFVLHLTPLVERIAAVQSQVDAYLGLSDQEFPTNLLHGSGRQT